jgi:hypothetical protein
MSKILERTGLQVQKVVADQQLLPVTRRSLTSLPLLKVGRGTGRWHTRVLLSPNSICHTCNHKSFH